MGSAPKPPVGSAPKPKGVGLIKTMSHGSQLATEKVDDECFKPFLSTGFVSLTGRSEDQHPVTVLRDTGGSQSFILSRVLPLDAISACGVSTIVRGIGMGFVPAPLHRIHVQTDLCSGFFSVAVRSDFPIEGVDFIMGNDIAGGKVYPSPEVVEVPSSVHDDLAERHPEVFTASVLTTRAKARKQAQDVDLSDSLFASVLSEEKLPPTEELLDRATQGSDVTKLGSPSLVALPLTREALIRAQRGDPSLAHLYAAVGEDPTKHGGKPSFLIDDGVLMRKWVSRAGKAADDGWDWDTVQQIVVPVGCRQHVLELAHEHLWSGHLGITKTYDRILTHFFWPGLKADVVRFCKSCHTC